MRICFLCQDRGVPLDGHKGAAAHVRGLVGAFARLGHDVVVVTGAAPSKTHGDLRLSGHPPVPVVEIEPALLLESVPRRLDARVTRALAHVWLNVPAERALRSVLDRMGAELIYERYSPFAVAGGAVARDRGIPHILEVNAPLAWEGKRYRKQALQDAAEALETAALARPDRIVAVSAELRDRLVSGGVEAERVAVIPNGVDTDLFRPGPRTPADPSAPVTIGFVGSLKAWHGLEDLATAFAELSEDPRFHLLVVGDGPMLGVFRELSDALRGRISLTGGVPHERVPALLGMMDIAVAPYPQLDGFYFSPLKILEYMAAGVPVVASAIGQVPTLVREGVTGTLVEPGNPHALATAIRELASDPGRRMAYGAAAAGEAAARHGWTARAEQILELIPVPV